MEFFDILVKPIQRLWMEGRGLDLVRKWLISVKRFRDRIPLYVRHVIDGAPLEKALSSSQP